jgi:hypothetical protein
VLLRLRRWVAVIGVADALDHPGRPSRHLSLKVHTPITRHLPSSTSRSFLGMNARFARSGTTR